jgi:hypothetical protein
MTAIGTLRDTSIDTLRDVLTRLEKECAALGHFNVADQVSEEENLCNSEW